DQRLRWSAGATTRRDVQSKRAEARSALPAKDDVIEDRDTEQEPSLPGVVRQLHIVVRWTWVPGRMVVNQDHRGSVGADSIAEAIRQADRGRCLAALVNR